MWSNKQNNEENPPAYTSPLQKNGEFVLSVRRNEAADCTGIFHNGNGAETDPMSCPYMSLPVAPFPWKNTHSTHQSYAHDISETGDNLMADFTRFNSLQNPQIESNSINIRSKVPSLYRPMPDFPCPEGIMKGVWPSGPSQSRNNMVAADNVIKSSGHFNSLQNPHVNRNFSLTMKGNAGEGYQVTRQGGPANSSNIHGPHINRNFVDLGGSTHPLFHTHNNGEIDIDNNICSSEKIDGSFLTLGIGGSTEAGSKFDLNSRQITNKSDEADSSQLYTSHVQQAARSSSSQGHNLAGGFSSFQNTVGGFSSLMQNVGGWTSSNDDIGTICGTNACITSSPFHILQKPQVEMQHYFPTLGNRNVGFVGNRDATYANLGPHKGFLGDLTSSSGPFSSNSTGRLDSGLNKLSGLASESAKFTQITTKPTYDQQQKSYMETVQNFPPESSMVSPFVGIRGSSTRKDHSGKLFPATEAIASQAESSQFLRSIGVQPDVLASPAFSIPLDCMCLPEEKKSRLPNIQGSYFLLTMVVLLKLLGGGLGVQVPEVNAAQAAGVGLFPKRLGVQVNEGLAAKAARGVLFPNRMGVQVAEGNAAQAAECRLYPKGIGIPSHQTASKLDRPQGSVPVQFPKKFLDPFAAGRPPQNVPFQFPIDLRGPSLASGRSQEGVPVHFSKDLLGPMSTTGQVIPIAKRDGLSQASNFLGRPSLKRSAVQPPPAAPWAHCRKIKVKHSAYPSMPSPQMTAPAAAPIPISMPGAPIPRAAVAPPHIKWPGFDGTPQPTGQKCLLCKRDLSFKPEGPVYQPTVPPAVAVLPCGHTFHDHCLQNITPEDQSKNPPCIPCAVGEI
ncbi:hypothetical protein F0562_024518 [Nyssa sinensis]|uniref:RING-type domain-containing protein n=1 Tax=Nyssa sinensis TaxID=561372 RepID=A0A5J5BBU1_9ASTE|nr:hypothetical protein F0562_024518 [Nyssa sinensis]